MSAREWLNGFLSCSRFSLVRHFSSLSCSLCRRSKGRFCRQRRISFVTVIPSTNLLPSSFRRRISSLVVSSRRISSQIVSSLRISSRGISLRFEGERVCVLLPYDLHVFGLCLRSTLDEVCMYSDRDLLALQ